MPDTSGLNAPRRAAGLHVRALRSNVRSHLSHIQATARQNTQLVHPTNRSLPRYSLTDSPERQSVIDDFHGSYRPPTSAAVHLAKSCQLGNHDGENTLSRKGKVRSPSSP